MVEGRTQYRIVIAGSREFVNYPLGEDFIIECIRKLPQFDKDLAEIVSGTAKGADKIGEEFSYNYNITVKQFPADWDNYGSRAGYIRNEQMAKYASEEGYIGVLIALWDGKSKGTKNMIDNANKYGLKTFIFDPN